MMSFPSIAQAMVMPIGKQDQERNWLCHSWVEVAASWCGGHRKPPTRYMCRKQASRLACFLQWFTGPTKGDEAIADPKVSGTPCGLDLPRGHLAKFGKFLETTMEHQVRHVALAAGE
jgi:hypothetical protein